MELPSRSAGHRRWFLWDVAVPDRPLQCKELVAVANPHTDRFQCTSVCRPAALAGRYACSSVCVRRLCPLSTCLPKITTEASVRRLASGRVRRLIKRRLDAMDRTSRRTRCSLQEPGSRTVLATSRLQDGCLQQMALRVSAGSSTCGASGDRVKGLSLDEVRCTSFFGASAKLQLLYETVKTYQFARSGPTMPTKHPVSLHVSQGLSFRLQ